MAAMTAFGRWSIDRGCYALATFFDAGRRRSWFVFFANRGAGCGFGATDVSFRQAEAVAFWRALCEEIVVFVGFAQRGAIAVLVAHAEVLAGHGGEAHSNETGEEDSCFQAVFS